MVRRSSRGPLSIPGSYHEQAVLLSRQFLETGLCLREPEHGLLDDRPFAQRESLPDRCFPVVRIPHAIEGGCELFESKTGGLLWIVGVA